MFWGFFCHCILIYWGIYLFIHFFFVLAVLFLHNPQTAHRFTIWARALRDFWPSEDHFDPNPTPLQASRGDWPPASGRVSGASHRRWWSRNPEHCRWNQSGENEMYCLSAATLQLLPLHHLHFDEGGEQPLDETIEINCSCVCHEC